jgi:hypothetical protein
MLKEPPSDVSEVEAAVVVEETTPRNVDVDHVECLVRLLEPHKGDTALAHDNDDPKLVWGSVEEDEDGLCTFRSGQNSANRGRC